MQRQWRWLVSDFFLDPPNLRWRSAPSGALVTLIVAACILLTCVAVPERGSAQSLPDADADGVSNAEDNCPLWSNPAQLDENDNGLGNDCECGDADGDGNATTLDARLIQRCVTGQLVGAVCDGLCDASGDGICNTLDARLIQRHVVGQIPVDFLACERRPPVAVPALVGRTELQASSLLAQAGLHVGTHNELVNPIAPSGSVIEQSLPAGLSVPAGARIDLDLSAPAAANTTTLPMAWQGIWDFELRSRDAASSGLLTQASFSGSICAGDPLGLWAVPDEVSCTGSASDERFEFACSAQTTVETCTIDFSITAAADRAGEAIAGDGVWSTVLSGACPGLVAESERIELDGQRRDPLPPSCAPPARSLSQLILAQTRFAGFAALEASP